MTQDNLLSDPILADITDAFMCHHQDLMQYNCFSLEKRKRIKPIIVGNPENGNFIEIRGDPKYGIATIWDMDVIIWLITWVRHRARQGLPTSEYIEFDMRQMMVDLGRNTGGQGYEELKRAIERLRFTSVTTNFREADNKRVVDFNWIQNRDYTENYEGAILKIRLRMAPWLHKNALNEKFLLSFDNRYFKMKKAIERCLYLIIRKHGGKQEDGYFFTFRQIYNKCNSSARFTNFAIVLRDITKKQVLADYYISSFIKEGEEILHFVKRTCILCPIEFREVVVPNSQKKVKFLGSTS